MYFIPEFIEKEAIAWNGHLFRRQAVSHIDDTGAHRMDFTKRTVGKSQGRGKEYTVTIGNDTSDIYAKLQTAGINGTDLVIPGDTPDVLQHNDLFFTKDSKLVPAMGVPRFASVKDAPRQQSWDYIYDDVMRRRGSTIVIDGHLVWVGKTQGGSQVSPVREPGLTSLFINPINSQSEADHIVIPFWDGMLWQVGPYVFATTEDEALHLQELLLRSALMLDTTYVSPDRRKTIENRLRDAINRQASELFNLLSQMTLAEPPSREWVVDRIKRMIEPETRTLKPRVYVEQATDELLQEWADARYGAQN